MTSPPASPTSPACRLQSSCGMTTVRNSSSVGPEERLCVMAIGAKGLEAVIERLNEQLSQRERSHVKFRTLITLAGQKKKSMLLVDKLEKSLAEARVFHFPASLRECKLSDTVLVSTKPFRDPGLPFANEGELAEFIVRYYRLLAPFSRCTSVKREDRRWGGKSGEKSIDLCFREQGGGYVVCELEHGSGGDETASQIAGYIEAVHSKLVMGRSKAAVRGVVVTGKENPAQEAEVAEWTQKTGFSVDWYYYRLSLALEPAPL